MQFQQIFPSFLEISPVSFRALLAPNEDSLEHFFIKLVEITSSPNMPLMSKRFTPVFLSVSRQNFSIVSPVASNYIDIFLKSEGNLLYTQIKSLSLDAMNIVWSRIISDHIVSETWPVQRMEKDIPFPPKTRSPIFSLLEK